MINTSGIYFLEDSNDCNYFVKDICKKVKIKLDLEIDFEKLISHVIIHQPEILIFNLKDYLKYKKYLQIFDEESAFYVPIVFILGNIEPDFALELPGNFVYTKNDEFEELITKTVQKLEKIGTNNNVYSIISNFQSDMILSELISLGFNVGTNGSQFLKACISEVIIDKCRPNMLTNTVYASLAETYETSVYCVVRCMKVAIATAWKRRKFDKTAYSGILSFNYFYKEPSVKEFIYYAANKIYDNMKENKLKNILGSNDLKPF